MKKYDYSELTGEVVTKDNFKYEENRKAWNRAIEKYPQVIIYCKEEKDIINAISWSKRNDLPIRIRSGAHNYEGFSTGNDLAVIDISKMNSIKIDEENRTVTIEGGVRNRELTVCLGSKGYSFPGGGCPTVGIAGLVLGGGWGYSSRLFGLACDSLLEVKFIDYNGNIIVANEELNQDLFWACKGGGGGNFGIAASMKFRLNDKNENATLINIDYLNINIDEVIDIIEIWQKEFNNIDRRLNFKMSIYNSLEKGKGIHITGLFYGTIEEANEILEPFKKVNRKVIFNSEYMTVTEANLKIQDSHPPYEKYKSTGRFVYREYSRNEIYELVNLIETRAKGSVYTALSLYGLGAAVSEHEKGESAFYYRDAKCILGFQSVWEEAEYAEDNRKWLIDRFEHIKSITTGSFINFPIAELHDYEKEYYGENLYKLKKVKDKYDPNNVFNYPQSIKGEKSALNENNDI